MFSELLADGTNDFDVDNKLPIMTVTTQAQSRLENAFILIQNRLVTRFVSQKCHRSTIS